MIVQIMDCSFCFCISPFGLIIIFFFYLADIFIFQIFLAFFKLLEVDVSIVYFFLNMFSTLYINSLELPFLIICFPLLCFNLLCKLFIIKSYKISIFLFFSFCIILFNS